MSFYGTKFKLNEGAIQDPDNIGIDLDEVEKNIAGEDGIEAHRDDVDAAVSGEIDDPVEEMAMIMYESEYNYNTLMQAIGLQELREASYGREFVLEAKDTESFFEKVKNIFKKMFEGLTKAVKDVLSKLDFQAKSDKKFVMEHKNAILKGGEKGFEFRGFDTKKIEDLKEFETVVKSMATDNLSQTKLYLAKLEKNITDEEVRDAIEEAEAYFNSEIEDKTTKNIARMIPGFDSKDFGADMSDFGKFATEKIIGSKVDVKVNKKMAEDAIAVLSAERETSTIRASYNNVKDSYKEALKQLDAMNKQINSGKYGPRMTKAMLICDKAIKCMRIRKNVLNTLFGVLLKSAKIRRSQCRYIVHAAVKKAKDTNTVDESASLSMFSRVSLL